MVHHRVAHCRLVFDRLTVVPDLGLRFPRKRIVAFRQLFHRGNLEWRWDADNFNGMLIWLWKKGLGAAVAVPSRLVVRTGAYGRTALAFGDKVLVDSGVHSLDSDGDEQIWVVVEGMAERRDKYRMAFEARLVVFI